MVDQLARREVVDPIVQRADGDCMLAAVASCTGLDYGHVSQVSRQVLKSPHNSGLWLTELERVVKRLGLRMKVVAPAVVLDDEGHGIVVAKFVRSKPAEYHSLCAFGGGWVIDPLNGLVWRHEVYLSAQSAAHGRTIFQNGILLYESR